MVEEVIRVEKAQELMRLKMRMMGDRQRRIREGRVEKREWRVWRREKGRVKT